ncbi:hypothetical protein [Amycolatopsis sp. lyj-112]|uniref:hypothetical protein n=1 Tax=Amycolatopsis sp. lyj-112 TaxID=2789288 RepID=UPI00397BF3A5
MKRDLSTGLHPVADLMLEGQDTAAQKEVRRKAALAVASRATDAADCAELLDMLGLHNGGRCGFEVA